jgi:hypothetical protein
MRVRRGLEMLLVLAISAHIAMAGPAQKSAQASFSVAISAPQTAVKAGSEIKINIILANTSDRQLVITVDRGAQGEFDYTIKLSDSNGHEPPETKYFRAVRGKDASDPGDTTTLVVSPSSGLKGLKPGETFKSTIDLTELYNLQQGRYAIQLERFDDKSKTLVKSNKLTVSVIP